MSSYKPRNIRFLRRHGKKLTQLAKKALGQGRPEEPDQRAKIDRRTRRLETALDLEPDAVTVEDFDRAVRKLEKALIVNDIWRPKSFAREIGEAFLVAAGIAFVVRSFIAEPFKIPTGSMIPTLQIEDFIFVTKFSYGLRLPFTRTHMLEGGRPDRGDVVVFDFPYPGEDEGKNFIKRVVAVPGDRVKLSQNRLHVNGKPATTRKLASAVPCEDGNGSFTQCICDLQEEVLGGVRFVTQHHNPDHQSPLCLNAGEWPLERPESRAPVYFGDRRHNSNWPEVLVPEDHYLVMGDNRDNSHDGRYWGLVPFDVIKGKAWIIWWARDKSRLFTAVHSDGSDPDHAHAATKRTRAPPP